MSSWGLRSITTSFSMVLGAHPRLSLIDCHERRRCICECNVDASCTWRAAEKKNGENPLDVLEGQTLQRANPE